MIRDFKLWVYVFTERLKTQLDLKGMTQRDFAKACGCAEVIMSRYIAGERTPKAPMIGKMAEVLGVTTDYLLGMDFNEIE